MSREKSPLRDQRALVSQKKCGFVEGHAPSVSKIINDCVPCTDRPSEDRRRIKHASTARRVSPDVLFAAGRSPLVIVVAHPPFRGLL